MSGLLSLVTRGKPYIIVDKACYGGEAENAPWSLQPGYQQIADGLSGVAWETGVASGLDEPVIPCLPISDYFTGTLCAVMAVLGLVRRAEPGKFGVKGNSFFSPISLTALDAW
jgi:crotonobetainyl-CoA:carnitine CoA-transferase CaiB-like acyl-CoA transferase